MAAFVEMSAGDSLVIGKSIIKLERKAGQRARLSIETSDDIEHIRAGDRTSRDRDEAPEPFLRRHSPAQPHP